MRNHTVATARIQSASLFVYFAALVRQMLNSFYRMPGSIQFQLHMSPSLAHGYIWIPRPSDMDLIYDHGILKIAYHCDNPAGVRKNLPYVQEEIIRQARLAGFEPIYLSCLGPNGEQHERSVDSTFAID